MMCTNESIEKRLEERNIRPTAMRVLILREILSM